MGLYISSIFIQQNRQTTKVMKNKDWTYAQDKLVDKSHQLCRAMHATTRATKNYKLDECQRRLKLEVGLISSAPGRIMAGIPNSVAGQQGNFAEVFWQRSRWF